MEIQMIEAAELKRRLDAGEATVLDVRRSCSERIPGAIQVHTLELETRYQELPREKLIVAY